MSTTLTNGIIIPDNGNRNWGGDLANNWNILDLNVGYMTDVKNRVTTLENSLSNCVDLSSDQTIAGAKTFTTPTIVGNPNDPTSGDGSQQAATTAWVVQLLKDRGLI